MGGVIIREAIVNVADEKDWAFINGLQSLGSNRNAAKLITYLKDVEEGSSRDIEMATDLRQPEVSVGHGDPWDMGWISERDVKGIGKGRPQKIYALRAIVEEILEHYEAEKNQESTRTIEAIQRLKELSPAL